VQIGRAPRYGHFLLKQARAFALRTLPPRRRSFRSPWYVQRLMVCGTIVCGSFAVSATPALSTPRRKSINRFAITCLLSSDLLRIRSGWTEIFAGREKKENTWAEKMIIAKESRASTNGKWQSMSLAAGWSIKRDIKVNVRRAHDSARFREKVKPTDEFLADVTLTC